jgi:hypothetical protein
MVWTVDGKRKQQVSPLCFPDFLWGAMALMKCMRLSEKKQSIPENQ